MVTKALSGGAGLEAYLAKLGEKVSSASSVKVGFLEGATYPDGTPVAMIAAIQNFGAPKRSIPPRPFFSNMIDKHGSEWGGEVAELLDRTGFDSALTLELMGERIEGQLRQEIVDTNSPPLSPKTIARKGGREKPLIDTAHMIGSIDSEVS